FRLHHTRHRSDDGPDRRGNLGADVQLTRVSALLGLAMLAGCADKSGDPTMTSCRPPACTPAKSSYAAEVVSVASSGPPTVEFADLILDDASGYFVLAMPTPAEISGHVTSGG